jgi:ABC-type nitrate/sulfonate/bicarbonate transport system substrate-binding protein
MRDGDPAFGTSGTGSSRREFCGLSARAMGAMTLLGGLGTLLTACGGDEGESAAGGPASTEVMSPKFAASTGVIPIFVQQSAGPLLYGKEFGLDVPRKNFLDLESHTVATQTVLSGDADIISGSTSGILAAVSQGIPVRFFCAARRRDDNVLVGIGPAKAFEDILKEDVRVSVDSKGGAGYAELQAVIDARLSDPLPVGSLPGFTALESSSQRQAALAAGQVDAAWMHVNQFWQVEKERNDAKVLAQSIDAPVWPMSGYAALKPWLDKNQATAVAIMKSVAACSKAFVEDFNEYDKAVQELIEEPPSKDDLRRLWEFAIEHDLWPTDGGVVTHEAYDLVAQLSKSAEVFIEAPSFEEAVDTRPGDAV